MIKRQDGKMICLRDQTLVEKVTQLAMESGTKPSIWVTELVKDWIHEHRSGKPFVGDPERYTERHDEFDNDEYDLPRSRRLP